MHYKQLLNFLLLTGTIALHGCGGSSSSGGTDGGVDDEMTSFTLNFMAKSGGMDMNCDNMLGGFGPNQTDSVGVRDLRFYISNIKFYDDAGAELDVELDENEFQYHSDAGFVALVDLTSNDSGTCDAEEGEGTARMNAVVTGSVEDTAIADMSFDVGLPQAIMKDVIATNSAEDAPSPLNEMFWSWASGYRHFVFNFQVMDTIGTFGEGYLHIGSRGCGGDGLLALEEKEECDFVNTPSVMLENFDPGMNSVVVDISAALENVDLLVQTQGTDESAPGVSCHSSPMQTDCATIFSNFGIDMETGSAVANSNVVFGME